MYGLASWELEGKDKYTLFLYKITHLAHKITINVADDTTWEIKAHRTMHLKYWTIGGSKRGMLSCELFDHLDEFLFSDYNGRSPIVSIVSQGYGFAYDHTDEYKLLYAEYLTWSYEGDE